MCDCKPKQPLLFIQEGMDDLDLLKFLKHNPSPENLSFVFPSLDDMKVTPELFMGAADIGSNDRNQRTLDYFKDFLQELHSGAISKLQNTLLTDE